MLARLVDRNGGFVRVVTVVGGRRLGHDGVFVLHIIATTGIDGIDGIGFCGLVDRWFVNRSFNDFFFFFFFGVQKAGEKVVQGFVIAVGVGVFVDVGIGLSF
jgi:hypothetical protein